VELRDLLPFERHTYISSMPPWELIDHLSDWIAHTNGFSFSLIGKSHEQPYEGEITGDQFHINRVIGYRNSFLPKISGRIEATDNGSIVHVSMRLNVFALVFMCLWTLIVGSILLVCLVIVLGNEDRDWSTAAGPAAMLAFGYAITIGGFKYESIQSRKDLEKALKAVRLNEPVPV
jgi:hypothetical protein